MSKVDRHINTETFQFYRLNDEAQARFQKNPKALASQLRGNGQYDTVVTNATGDLFVVRSAKPANNSEGLEYFREQGYQVLFSEKGPTVRDAAYNSKMSLAVPVVPTAMVAVGMAVAPPSLREEMPNILPQVTAVGSAFAVASYLSLGIEKAADWFNKKDVLSDIATPVELAESQKA